MPSSEESEDSTIKDRRKVETYPQAKKLNCEMNQHSNSTGKEPLPVS